MKTLLSRKLSLVFLIVQFLISAALIGVTFYVGFIPLKFIVLLIVGCLFLLAYGIFSQMTDKTYIVGRVFCALICLFYIGGGYYCVDTYSAIDEMAGHQVKVDEISCIVLKDDPAQSIYDTKDYTFGILATNDRANTDKALAEVQAAVGKQPATMEYQDNDTLIDALYAKEVNAIIINEANRSPIEEYYKTFSDDTRVLNTHKVETVMEEEEKLDDITKTPFNVYLSGIDVYGSIKTTSRSDVNVIVTVNPNTKQILLTSTPRDYYVPLTVSNGIPDKLTHAGIHGVDCSVGTLENLYDIKIDYYVRVNFTSVKKIVDLLGGVNVYSDYDFTSDWGPSFKKGYNHVNGKQALAFCRERHHFSNGDYQRGRDHQHMIEAILNKAMSPDILPNYAKLLKTASKNFQTNMSTKEITALAKMQLNDMSQWTIKYANAAGSGASKTTYSYQSRKLYVCVPDYNSVAKITKRINKVLEATPESVENEKDDDADESTAMPGDED
ncbi:MAG: LCP family protein [Clostridiales bacterium]|nr:LCP family protein [Clostridiales bacterium]